MSSVSHSGPDQDVRSWFEAQRLGDSAASIESAMEKLGSAPPETAREIFTDLLRIDIECRRTKGESPIAGEYHQRFPDFTSHIDEVFSSSIRPDSESLAMNGELPIMGDTHPPVLEFPSQNGAISIDEQTRPHATCFQPGEVLAGRYEIKEQIGWGGMSEVYAAYDRRLNKRLVAVKVVKAEHRQSLGAADLRRRLVKEAAIAAGLEHHGIVSVYDTGRCENREPFYVMQVISRAPQRQQTSRSPQNKENASPKLKAGFARLAEAITSFHDHDWSAEPVGARKLAQHELLNHVVDACKAAGYAHGKGILHRDIKPQNIMIDGYGQTKLVDWGLAKKLEEESAAMAEPTGFTHASFGMGTPAYMSPEQAGRDLPYTSPQETGPEAPRKVPIDSRTDVYGLGATLYHVLTNQKPIEGESELEVMTNAREGKFTSPPQTQRRGQNLQASRGNLPESHGA